MIGLYAAVLAATLFGTIVSAALFLYAWKRRQAPVAARFSALMASIALTSLFYVAIWSSGSRETAYFFAQLRFAALPLMAALYLLFVLEYIGWQPWRKRWRGALLFVIPLIAQAFMWTNGAHGLYTLSWDIVQFGPFTTEVITYGPVWQVQAVHSYACMLAGILLLLRTAMISSGVYAVQAIMMFFGSLVVFIINIPVSFLFADTPIPNLTPISYTVTGAILAFALQRHRLLELVPVALDVVYNSMDDAVLVMDVYDRVVAANPAALKVLGQTSDRVIGHTMDEAFELRTELLKAIHDLHGQQGEISDSADGQRYFDLRISPVSSNKNISGKLLALRDTTQRRIAEKRALELTLEQEKIRLLAGFIRDTSHDLRTPLTVMNTALYLARKTDDPVKRETKLSDIEQQIIHIQRIIDGLLLLTTLDTATTMEISVFRLSALIDPLPVDIRKMIEKKHQLFTVDIQDDTARGDVTLLRRAVHNLLQNASLYTPEYGQITVRGSREDDDIVIEVEDTGVGIAPQDLNGIFDRFTKVNRARTQDGSGAGLGLAIVRKIAQIHSGTITAESTPGQGSMFRLVVPASQRPKVGTRTQVPLASHPVP
jgi:PAS domain S-box-containing protein